MQQTEITLPTPLANGNYHVCVDARSVYGEAKSATNNGLPFTVETIDDIPPGPFTINGPTGTIFTSLPTVQWSAAEGADKYDLVIATDAACVNAVQNHPDLTATSFSLTDPLADQLYFTCVTALDEAGNTTAADNNGLAFTVDAVDDIPPGPFDILGPTGTITDDMPEVSWDESTDALSYNVIVADDAECTSPVETMNDVAATSVMVSNPLADGDYFTCVTSFDAAGNSTAANNNGLAFSVDAIDDVPPGPFDILSPSGQIPTKTPTVTWTVSQDAVKYDLGISLTADCSEIMVLEPAITTTSHTLPSELPIGTYSTCLTAYDAADNTINASNNGLVFTIKLPLPARHEIFVTSANTYLDGSPSYPPSYPGFGHLNAADWICSFSAFNAGKIPGWDGQSTP